MKRVQQFNAIALPQRVGGSSQYNLIGNLYEFSVLLFTRESPKTVYILS